MVDRSKVNRVLLGDTARAATWLPFAYLKLAELEKLPAPYMTSHFRPEPDTLVIVQKLGEFAKLFIEVLGGLRYEFVANDLFTVPIPLRPNGHAFVFDFAKDSGQYLGPVVFPDDRPFITSTHAWTIFNTAAPVVYAGRKKELTTSHRFTLKHLNFLPARCAGNRGTAGLNLRNFQINQFPGLGRPPTSWRGPVTSGPYTDLPTASTIQQTADTGSTPPRTLSKPLVPWHSVSTVHYNISGQAFFLYTDSVGDKLYAFARADTYPTPPTPIGEAVIPVPGWATHPAPGLRQPTSGMQWAFNADGTRLVGIVHELVAQDFKKPTSDGGAVINNAVRPSLNIPRDRAPNPGTFNSIFASPTTVDQQIYQPKPGIVEYAVEVTQGEGGITVGLTLIRELRGSTTGRYYIGVDYLFGSNDIAVMEAELFVKNGSLYTLYDETDGVPGLATATEDKNTDPYGISTPGQLETVFYTYDADNIATEHRRVVTMQARFIYRRGVISSVDYFEHFVEDDQTAGTKIYDFYFGGVDLRSLAYWGVGQQIDVEAEVGKTWYRSFTEYAHNSKALVRTQVANDTHVFPDLTPPARPGDYQVVSPFNVITNMVLGMCHWYLWTSEISTHPLRKSFAVCTPVLLLACGKRQGGSNFTEVFRVPTILDVVETDKKTTTHRDLYQKIRTATPVPSQPPDRDYPYYIVDEADRPLSGGNSAWPFVLNSSNMGSFRAGGIWFGAEV